MNIKHITKKEQADAIKKRLIDAIDRAGLNYNQLSEGIKKKIGFEVNYETIKHTLDFAKPSSLNLICVIAICRYLNLDTAYVLSEPDNPNSAMYEIENNFISERYSILDDPKYTGEYYGYFYTPKKTNIFIDEFRLEIKPEFGKTIAYLTIYYQSIKENEEIKITPKTLIGTPILVKPSNVFILFKNDDGQFIFMSFSYVFYNVRNLYFRRGTIITHGRNAARYPLMQSFVLFSKKISKENIEKYIPGFLLLNDTVFHIPASQLDELRSKHQEVDKLYNELNSLFRDSCEMYYCVNQDSILSAVKKNISENDVVRALQIMKSHATDAKRIYFPEIEEFSEFAKLLNS